MKNINLQQKQNLFLVLFSAISSFLILMVCTRSSFFYPFNDWVDANCFFTVGKAIGNGQIVYRDIFEQKGILLYLLHTIAYFISHNTFIGVFFIEVIAGTFFMFFNIKIAQLYTNIKFAIFSASICSVLIYSSRAFCKGDSAEELCLPILTFSLYLSTKAFKTNKYFSRKQLFITGIVSACILWIKYTMLGFYIGWIIIPVIWLIKEKNFKKIGETFLYIFLGVAVVSLPIVVYFLMNNSIQYLWEVYFYKNVVTYSNTGENLTFGKKFSVIFDNVYKFTKVSMTDNYQRFSGVLCIGFIGLLFIKGKKQKLSVYIMFCTSAAFIFGGGNGYVYYSIPLNVFTIFGPVSLYLLVRFIFTKLLNKKLFFEKFNNNIYVIIVSVFMFFVSTLSAFALSYNVDFIKTKKEDLVQYKFKEIIEKEKNPTLLNIGYLDGGFYTVCDIVPNCRYFCKLNSSYKEVYDGQMEYIKEGKGMFIVAMDNTEVTDSKYEKVAEETIYYDEAKRDMVYRLYKLKQSVIVKE